MGVNFFDTFVIDRKDLDLSTATRRIGSRAGLSGFNEHILATDDPAVLHHVREIGAGGGRSHLSATHAERTGLMQFGELIVVKGSWLMLVTD